MREDGEDDSEPFRIFAVNWPTLQIFWATWKQWRKIAINNTQVRDCMDWTQAKAALELCGIKRTGWPLIFEGLRAAEQEAIEFLSKE